MIITKTIKCFKAEDATKEQLQGLCEKYYDINLYDDYDMYLIEDFKNILELIGCYNVKFYYSGFCSQGDGASFECNYNYSKNNLFCSGAYSQWCVKSQLFT